MVTSTTLKTLDIFKFIRFNSFLINIQFQIPFPAVTIVPELVYDYYFRKNYFIIVGTRDNYVKNFLSRKKLFER